MAWTRQRLMTVTTVIFVAHVVVIYALHTPAPMVKLRNNFRSPRVGNPSPSMAPPEDLDVLNDPLVFAGAHEHGFSAPAWLMRPRDDYAVSNTVSPPRFLAFSRSPSEIPAPEKLPQRVDPLPFVKMTVSRETPKSILVVEGDLKSRPLMRVVELPTQLGSEVLAETVIQVGIRPDGFPLSARIISGSGSRVADLTALDMANRLRFAPLAPGWSRESVDLQWGELEFRWFTTEPPPTNPAAATAPAPK